MYRGKIMMGEIRAYVFKYKGKEKETREKVLGEFRMNESSNLRVSKDHSCFDQTGQDRESSTTRLTHAISIQYSAPSANKYGE